MVSQGFGHGRVASFNGTVVKHCIETCWDLDPPGHNNRRMPSIQFPRQRAVIIFCGAHAKPGVRLVEAGGHDHLFWIRDDNDLAFERAIGMQIETPVCMVTNNAIDGEVHGIARCIRIACQYQVSRSVRVHAVQIVLHTNITEIFGLSCHGLHWVLELYSIRKWTAYREPLARPAE